MPSALWPVIREFSTVPLSPTVKPLTAPVTALTPSMNVPVPVAKMPLANPMNVPFRTVTFAIPLATTPLLFPLPETVKPPRSSVTGPALNIRQLMPADEMLLITV